MATRTSHSSPCFLRVAEASAHSSASKMTSLSTPFSLETASTTIRISLFISLQLLAFPRGTRSRCQPRLRNLAKWQLHTLPINFQGHASRRDFLQRPGESPPPIARRFQLNQHPGSLEALEMRVRPQHPIVTRRGHFQRIGRRNRILDIQQRRDLAADALAVGDTNTLGPVDEDPQGSTTMPRCKLQLHQLVAQLPEQGLDQRDEPIRQGRHEPLP